MGTRLPILSACRARLVCATWTLRGRLALVRGDRAGTLTAFEQAVASRPGAFGPLLRLGRAYLEARETWRAHRTLAQAREADPDRFTRRVGRWIARDRVDVELLRTVLAGAPGIRAAGERVAQAAVVARETIPARVAPQSLPWGDCQDLDEYARFRAMPPITSAEREMIDWDAVIADLLEE